MIDENPEQPIEENDEENDEDDDESFDEEDDEIVEIQEDEIDEDDDASDIIDNPLEDDENEENIDDDKNVGDLEDAGDVYVETALNMLATQIEALNDKDFDMFNMIFTTRIQQEMNDELFAAALQQHEKIPLSLDMIDKSQSGLISKDRIRLMMTNGRPLCHLVLIGTEWLVDDIYWAHD